jgi:plastocyanin
MRHICTSIIVTLALAGSALAETHTVLANNSSFSPDSIDVEPGDTIVWQYNSGYPHTVTSGVPCTPDGLFFSELDGGNPTFTWEVPVAASAIIPYFCEPHCGMGMTGVIYIAKPPNCASDINGDGQVGVNDLLIVIDQWGECDDDCSADLNGDEEVGVNDLLIVLDAWGPCP